MFKGDCECIPTVSILYFGVFSPFLCSPSPFYLPSPIFQQLSMYILISSNFTDVMSYGIIDALPFSFPFPLFLSFISSSTVTNLFYTWVCKWSCLFLCICLSFGYIVHIWEKTCSLCFSELGLFHLTWCPSIASIYFLTTHHYSLWLSKTPSCINTTFSWSIHQL
jgi:hypothetical protein